MKKFAFSVLILSLVLYMCACHTRRRQDNTATHETTQPITVPTFPDMTIPSTNIPDPTVESNSTTPTITEDNSNNSHSETGQVSDD